jgi:hypothetical protein
MITRADQLGPGKDDADWLVALAAADAAARIEAAVAKVEATAAACGMPPALADRLDQIEKLVKARIPQADPIGLVARYVCVFVAGAASCEAAFFALSWRWLPPVFGTTAAFVCGLSLTAAILLYLWLWPLYRDWRKAQRW